MRRTEQIIYDVAGQSLLHRFIQGRPTAVTFTVREDGEDDDAVATFSGSASIDTADTTVDAASGPSQANPHKLSVAATTGFVAGRKYRLSENAQVEWVEPVEIVAGDYMIVRHPLRNGYGVGAALESTYASVAIDATFIADEDNINDHRDPNAGWRVRLEATIGGATFVEYSFFDVVRALVESQITIADIEAHGAPNLVNTLPDYYRRDQGRRLIESADRIVRARLHAIELNDAALRDMEALDEFTILVAKRLLAEGGWAPSNWTPQEYYEIALATEERWFEQHFAIEPKRAISAGTGGGVTGSSTAAPPLWVK